MALPNDFDIITIKGTYLDFLGQPPTSGTITMTPSASHIKHLESDTIIIGGPRTVSLQPDGTFTIQVPIGNDPDVLPSFQYDVNESITLVGGMVQRRYTVDVPLSLLPGPVDMSDIVAIGSAPTGSTVLTRFVADTLYAPLGSTGPGGEGGEPELRVDSGYIQWRVVGDADWTNLIALNLLAGPAGDDGDAAAAPEFRVASGWIEWSNNEGATWSQLVELVTLKGSKGDTGDDGDDGLTPNLVIGSVTTGAAGSSAVAEITGTAPDFVLNLTIPKGDAGTGGGEGGSDVTWGTLPERPAIVAAGADIAAARAAIKFVVLESTDPDPTDPDVIAFRRA